MFKLNLKVISAFLISLSMLLPVANTYAANALGEIEAKGKEVVVQLSDGSEVTLKEGEKYPLYPDSIITTKEDSQAVLDVEGGTYVIEQESTFIANVLNLDSTSLSIVGDIPGEACYCFEPNAAFLVDTLITKTTPHESGAVQQANYKLYVQGRTDLTDGNATAYQKENKADFSTPAGTYVLEEGDEKSYPIAENEEDVFESRSGCCSPGVAAILATTATPIDYVIPVVLGSALVTGTIIGLTNDGDGDNPASNVTPGQ